jgi:hypothetical protein
LLTTSHPDNKLQTDTIKKVDKSDVNNYLVLNNQAKEIIKLYSEQIAGFEDLANSWSDHQAKASVSSQSASFTSGEAYEGIRAMGKEAVPLIMDKYATETDGWWHELLHEKSPRRKIGC